MGLGWAVALALTQIAAALWPLVDYNQQVRLRAATCWTIHRWWSSFLGTVWMESSHLLIKGILIGLECSVCIMSATTKWNSLPSVFQALHSIESPAYGYVMAVCLQEFFINFQRVGRCGTNEGSEGVGHIERYTMDGWGGSFFVQVLLVMLCSLIFLWYCRVCDVLGYQPQDLLGELCYDFFHPDDLNHMMNSYEEGKFCSPSILHYELLFRSITRSELSSVMAQPLELCSH